MISSYPVHNPVHPIPWSSIDGNFLSVLTAVENMSDEALGFKGRSSLSDSYAKDVPILDVKSSPQDTLFSVNLDLRFINGDDISVQFFVPGRSLQREGY